MKKPNHLLQKTVTCSSKSRKIRKGSLHCVWNSALHFVRSIFSHFSHWCLVFFWQKTHLPCETDFSMSFTPSNLSDVLGCAIGPTVPCFWFC